MEIYKRLVMSGLLTILKALSLLIHQYLSGSRLFQVNYMNQIQLKGLYCLVEPSAMFVVDDAKRYTEEQLNDCTTRRIAAITVAEGAAFVHKNDDPWIGFDSKMYKEGLLGDRILLHKNYPQPDKNNMPYPPSIYAKQELMCPQYNPLDRSVMDAYLETSYVKNLRRNFKYSKHCLEMLKRMKEKQKTTKDLPNAELQPKVEDALKSLFRELMDKQEQYSKDTH